VIRGNEEEVTAKLDEMEPVLMDVLQTNFEELFIYELESRGETK
jgi:ABC-2 type transport system ATP-binding protein